MNINTIILAAGQGTRMHSRRAKVLQGIGGRPMLAHVIDTAATLGSDKRIVVYGHDGEQVRQAFPDTELIWIHQEEQLGTAHAVLRAMAAVEDNPTVLVLYGDTPLVTVDTLQALLASVGDGVALLTAVVENPAGYGRILRGDDGSVQAIVEHKDATAKQLTISEINTGIIAMAAERFRQWLKVIDNDNAQNEYYLTDIIGLAVADGVSVNAHVCDDVEEVMGINNRLQQAEAEAAFQRRECTRQMLAGVMMCRPETVSINGDLVCGRDVVIEQNVVFNGSVTLGNDVTIGTGSVISNTTMGDGVTVLPYSVIDDARIGDRCRIGPFARIRPDTILAEQVHIGNFVEVKKSSVAARSKVNHLSYVGDTTIGKDVNIGAGTITCNYDGANKYQTRIEDNAFIGSDTQLVAPVTIGAGTTVAAGSTITRDVEEGVLVLSRVAQKTVKNWKRPAKKT
jgi:bifunctional UDP-N-acetylglucosamine pyrophosphorylase/glucosamine-1-phosphate N-acetyltransferase